MRLSDQKIVEFLSKSPLKSFRGMLDVLRYLDGKWIWADVEYEILDAGLGDNPSGKVSVRAAEVRGISTNMLFSFTHHARRWHVLKRQSKKMRNPDTGEIERIVFYRLTSAGKQLVRLLSAIARAGSAK